MQILPEKKIIFRISLYVTCKLWLHVICISWSGSPSVYDNAVIDSCMCRRSLMMMTLHFFLCAIFFAIFRVVAQNSRKNFAKKTKHIFTYFLSLCDHLCSAWISFCNISYFCTNCCISQRIDISFSPIFCNLSYFCKLQIVIFRKKFRKEKTDHVFIFLSLCHHDDDDMIKSD